MFSVFEIGKFYKRYIDEKYGKLNKFMRISTILKELLSNNYNKLGQGNIDNGLSSFCDSLLTFKGY